MDKSQIETVLRMAITGLQNAQSRMTSLPDVEEDVNIQSALARISKADNSIRLWAKKHRYEVTETMKT